MATQKELKILRLKKEIEDRIRQLNELEKAELPFDIPSLDSQLDKVFSAMAKIPEKRKGEN